MYEFLQRRGFKTSDTVANYAQTWPTVLATFLANHHYLWLRDGKWDTKYGRAIMAGIEYNPVLSVLKKNGYQVQYIQHQPYFTKEKGLVDYKYPPEPAFSALRVFQNPVLNYLFGEEQVFAASVSTATQTKEFENRLSLIYRANAEPWFTFAYFHLPGHFPTSADWRTAGGYEKEFRDKDRKANEHMRRVIERILAFDRDAVIVVMGDHGSWRYRDAWRPHSDPNESFASNGLSPELVALDMFGIMLAVYSGGRCDQEIYATITPVNVMRAVLGCLSGTPLLLEERPPDIALFSPAFSRRLWLTAVDGKPLNLWKNSV